MLRDSNTAANAAAQLLKMMFGWQSYRVQSFLRTVVYFIICIAIFLLWTVCGLYAPYIYTRTSSDVLLAQSPFCGEPQVSGGVAAEDLNTFEVFTTDTINGMTLADTYVQQCYGNGTEDAGARCISYPSQSLPFSTSNGEFPFDDKEVCILVNSAVMTLDTGLLDSSRDFGINARHEDTVQYRRVSTCSPLHTTGYANIINTTGTPLAADYLPGEILIQYMYGPEDDNDFTYQYEYHQMFYPIGYTVKVSNYIPGSINVHDSWVANTTFYRQTDGDVSLVFLAGNGIKYGAPVYDPFFAAGLDPQNAVLIPYQDKNVTFYTSTHAVTLLGCKEQHQFYFGGSDSNCTPLGSISNLLNETAKLQSNNKIAHEATAGHVAVSLPMTSIAAVLSDRGASALLASRTLNGLQQIADFGMDHWRQEVNNWHSIALARMQALVLAYATGLTNPEFNRYVRAPNPYMVKYECKTQRVRDLHGYVNFDLAGLIVLVVVGAGLVLLGFTFETLVGWVSKLSPRLRARRAKWLSEGLYHLHEETLQARGVRELEDEDCVMPKSHWTSRASATDDGHQAVSFLHVPKG